MEKEARFLMGGHRPTMDETACTNCNKQEGDCLAMESQYCADTESKFCSDK